MSDTVIQSRPVGHPLAGERMSGARMIMQVLADEGVTAIFGYSGGAILPTYDAVFLYNEQCVRLGEPQIPLIVPANEQGAGFMAAGYARSSGRVGAFIVTSGPGATNSVTPIRDCQADSIPVVLITLWLIAEGVTRTRRAAPVTLLAPRSPSSARSRFRLKFASSMRPIRDSIASLARHREGAPSPRERRRYAARIATTSTGTARFKLPRDPLGSLINAYNY